MKTTTFDSARDPRAGIARFQRAVFCTFLACGAIISNVSSADEFPFNPNPTTTIADNAMPLRVHVTESFETDIEKQWWLRGEIETKNVPTSRSASVPNRHVFRAAKTLNFDRKMQDCSQQHKGIVFNPVPGPPMGKRTRLSFRYHLKGTDSIQVQIYSLSKNYHRHLTLRELPQGKWQDATVNMTAARRPDGSGGPLAADERIDDIQFYIPADAELLIDDIVLYEAADDSEMRKFPRRVIFTAWFDTGKQGAEWPGDFEIVLHEKPLTWDAAKSVINKSTGSPWIRVSLRGQRRLSSDTSVRFRYRLKGNKNLRVLLVNSKTSRQYAKTFTPAVANQWSEANLQFDIPLAKTGKPALVDEIRYLVDRDSELWVDDILIYEPGTIPE